MALSAEQSGVAENTGSHTLIIALPSSDKTFTMISYIDNVVANPNTNLIALTFTNAASLEVKARVSSKR